MNRKYRISKRLLTGVVHFLENEKKVGHLAKGDDMFFLADGTWLKDAAVIDEISMRLGAWDIILVFAHYRKPLQLIVRTITRCYSKQKALATAFYMRKEAAKDRRGTLKVSIKDFGLCCN